MSTTDDALLADGITLQRALMGSASTDNISPKQWWDRATTAIETAAAAADDWATLVTRACRKLQIEVLSEHSSVEIAGLAERYADPDAFEELRAYVQHNAVFITALNRADKAAQKTTNDKPTKKTTTAPTQEALL